MSEEPSESKPSGASGEYQATVRRRRRLSSVWLVPVVALCLAGWLLWKNKIEQGPLATVSFETAEGLAAGKSEVRCRSVRVGIVETIRLASGLDSVSVGLRLDPDYAELLRDDTRFWVVRPRVSTGTVSGLGTLISGSYVELEPGESSNPASYFTGLEEPPVTGGNIPGLKLTLVANEAGSLSVGAPIYYRGFAVGKVERRALDLESEQIRFEIFIEEKYSSLVRSTTRFWNTSGINVSAGANGFEFRTPSVQTLVSGGASFTNPTGPDSGAAADDGDTFELYEDETAARDASFNPDLEAMLLFDQSVRGLKRGAPVEFRGIPLGRVVEISYRYADPGDARVPVLIELDTSAFQRAADLSDDDVDLANAVERGLRAKLTMGSIITSALFVELDLYPDAEPAELGKHRGYDLIPTISSGLAQLEGKLNAILSKLESLPLEETMVKFGNAADEAGRTLADGRETLDKLDAALVELKTLVASDSTQNLPDELNQALAELRRSVESLGPAGAVQGDLRRTLDELRSALRSFDSLSNTINEKPNSLLFGRDKGDDPTPRARR